jgi:hypothetical protein
MALESDKNPYYAPPLSTRDTDKAAILIVDDRPEKLLAFQSILEQLGQHLILAQSGSEALKRVLEREFAVILLDVKARERAGVRWSPCKYRHRYAFSPPIAKGGIRGVAHPVTRCAGLQSASVSNKVV